jgi:hypothetical protein
MFAYQLDPALYAAHMYRTSVCKSVSLGKKCNHEKCAFAHTRAEIRPNRCPYDQTCHGCNRYHSHQNVDAFLDVVCKDVKWPSFETVEKKTPTEEPSNAYTVPCNGKCGLQTCFFAHDENQLRVVPCRNANDHDHSECQYFHQTDTKSSYIARRKFVFPSTSFVIRIEDDDEDDEDDENADDTEKYISLSISKLMSTVTIPSA